MMKGFNFTERMRGVLARAREHAQRLDHEYVGGEHILLALLDEEDGIAIHVIRDLGADPRELAESLERVLQRGVPKPSQRGDLPYTSRAKKSLELAMKEAHELHHQYVGTEHLLLGLIAEKQGIAAQVLHEAGITPERAREEVARLVGTPLPRPDTGAEQEYVSVRGPRVEITLRQGNALTHKTFGDIPAAIEFLQAQQPPS